MAGKRIVIPNYMPALDLNGNPLAGAKITFYENETTTLASVYANEALTVPLANPVVANLAGVFPSIFADEDLVFTVAITDADDNPIGGLRNKDEVRPSQIFGADAAAAEIAAAAAEAFLADALAIQAVGDDAAAIAARASKSANGSDFADPNAVVENLGYVQSGTGALAEAVSVILGRTVYPEQFGAVGDGSTNDSLALNRAMTAAVALQAQLKLMPGKTYDCDTTLTTPAGLDMDFNGATISTGQQITLIDIPNSGVTLRAARLRGPSSTYSVSAIGIRISGVVNGAGVAPTYVNDTVLTAPDIENFGYLAIQPLYDRRTKVTDPTIRNCGYGGIITQGSVDFVGTGGLFDTFTGETGTGDLEALGISWSCADNELDFVRYPPSKNCVWYGGTFKNCPTWSVLDTHGGEDCHFVRPTIIDCRRAVWLVARAGRGPIRCSATGVTAYNNFAQGAVNTNGSSKRDCGFLISGDSGANPAQGCHISGYIKGFGSTLLASPVAAVGLVRSDQACSLDVHVVDPYGAGVSIDTDAKGSVRAIIENPQSSGVSPATTSPCYVKVDGTGTDTMNVTLDVSMIRSNAALNTHVGVRALVSSGTLANMRLNFQRLSFDAGIDMVTTSDLGTVFGEYPVTFTMDVGGLSLSSTPVTIWRRGSTGYISVPLTAGTSTSGAFTLGTTTPLPAYMRPSDTLRRSCYIMNDSVTDFGLAEIGTGGLITLYKDAAGSSWTATGSKRLYDQVWEISL